MQIEQFEPYYHLFVIPTVGPNQVLVKISHSGLCGTDVHYQHADISLGHEGAGTVQAIGENTTLFKIGDHVGWGHQHNACSHCKQCLCGKETLCPARQMFGQADLEQGSRASHAIWNEKFLFNIPDSILNQYAVPLRCAGATVFNVLQMYQVKSTDRVGVIGIGGLGHLTTQFATT